MLDFSHTPEGLDTTYGTDRVPSHRKGETAAWPEQLSTGGTKTEEVLSRPCLATRQHLWGAGPLHGDLSFEGLASDVGVIKMPDDYCSCSREAVIAFFFFNTR